MASINDIGPDRRRELWRQTTIALERGDFTALEEMLIEAGVSVIDVLDANDPSPEQLAEALTWAAFTGRDNEVVTLLDRGVDPAAGIATGMSALHWAANRGNLETVKILIDRGAPLEQKNMYDGTVLSCTLYSAVNEHCETHAAIAKTLIDAGAEFDDEWLGWWDGEDPPSVETKERIATALRDGLRDRA